MRAILWAVLFVACSGVGGFAADVPVVYTVDDNAIKQTPAGANLTFNLYSDATCTALVHSTAVAIEDLTVFSRLKQRRPAGAPKPPKADDLRLTLIGVIGSTPLYLKVTGAGVVPIGGACQAQLASFNGVSSGGVLLRDSNGVIVGPLLDAQFAVLSVAGTNALVSIYAQGFRPNGALYFTSSDCTGQALVQPDADNALPSTEHDGVTVWVNPRSGGSNTLTGSRRIMGDQLVDQVACGANTFTPPNGCCDPHVESLVLAPPDAQGTISGFVPPLTVEVP